MPTTDINKPELKVQPVTYEGTQLMNDMLSFEIPFLDMPKVRGTLHCANGLVVEMYDGDRCYDTINNAK